MTEEFFTRNEFKMAGKYNIPIIKKQDIDINNLQLIAFSEIRKQGKIFDKMKTIHFFIHDYKFNNIYYEPAKYLKKLSRFKAVLTPDYSLYSDMPKAIQISNVFKNRWCGAYWKSKGLTVIPTISWGLSNSYEFCFDGIEQGAIVAISTLGCRKSKLNFMRGYDKMLEQIKPKAIICYYKPFKEMKGNVIEVPYFRNIKEMF